MTTEAYMYKALFFFALTLSSTCFSQTTIKPDPNSSINAQEQINGLPGGSTGAAYSVRTKKRSVKMPSHIAPVENLTPASCADSLGGKGGASFTACEAGKKTR